MAIPKSTYRHVPLPKQHESQLRSRILSVAQGYLGTPYKLGGKSRDGGIDCSGFITNVLLAALDTRRFKPLVQNIELLRTSPELETVTTPEKGDLVLWEGHGGIVFDPSAGQFIGSQTSTGVAIASYRTGYWSKQRGLMFRKFGSYFYQWAKSLND